MLMDIFGKIETYIYLGIHYYTCRRGSMPLTRKARIVGSSLVITIPSQLAKIYNINDGDDLAIIPTKIGEFKIRKVEQ